ncbi:MAG: hypothetical protein LBR35_00125 [Rickettsiales bacterium]|nr:hypothetical protein [Rickettsiales bacterium]
MKQSFYILFALLLIIPITNAQRKITYDEAIGLMITRTNQYAKRQRTWFNNQLPTVNTKRISI